MEKAIIDPITRIEGHLRVEMNVDNGVVTDAWVSGNCFRGMELVVQDRTPEDAAQIVQRICGVCPVSHSHASTIAAEKAYGITISNGARLIRNLIEGAQFLHSHILWFYNLCALDYVNPLNALDADVSQIYDIAGEYYKTNEGEAITSTNTDFVALKERLQKFADNGQLSIFSGNWFGADNGEAYKLSPELDLVCTAHYLEALKMQARASEIAALLGGKMPHVMTITPGGTSFYPTESKLDDLLFMAKEIHEWVKNTMIQDTLVIADAYKDVAKFGQGVGRWIAWGVFEGPDWPDNGNYTDQMINRYLPMAVVHDDLTFSDVKEDLITEYVGHSWYKGSATYTSPYFVTEPDYQGKGNDGYNVDDRYTWVKCPAYDGKPYEAGGLSRVIAAYLRAKSNDALVVPELQENIVDKVDFLLKKLGAAPGDLTPLVNTLGRTAARQIETLYISKLMIMWTEELMAAIAEGDSDFWREPSTTTGSGTGFWEAPRGALYHSEKVTNGNIDGYQIIIPSTWNLAPHNADNEPGPMEAALIGDPVEDIEMPINALRTVHSFDPCTACAVHITEQKTGKTFKTVTSPWGVK